MRAYYIIRITLVTLTLLMAAFPFVAQGFNLIPCDNTKNDPCTLQDFFVMVIGLYNLLVQMSGVIAVIAVVGGAGKIMDAALYGNPEHYQAGKKTIYNALVGLGLILLAYTFGNAIANILFPCTFGPEGASPWSTPWVTPDINRVSDSCKGFFNSR